MSWADVKRKYQAGGTSAGQSTEDMAARCILRALGLSERTLPNAERVTGTAECITPDSTLLERATAVAATVACLPALPPVRDVKSPQEAEDMAVELGEQARGRADLVYRVRGDRTLMAMIRLGSLLVDTDNMPMPCRLFRSRDCSCVLLACEARTYYAYRLRGGRTNDNNE